MLEIGVRSDPGKVRPINEDYYCISQGRLGHEEYALLAVADGMGGHQAGDVASEAAISRFRQEVQMGMEEQEGEFSELLKKAVFAANRAIWELARSDQQYEGMGTTLTAALILQAKVYLAHVGDSRAYLVRGEQCTQLTEDHSLVGELVKSGSLSEEEAQRHPQRNLILRALGTSLDVEVDVHSTVLEQGDVLLLCSDGLSTLLSRERIVSLLSSGAPLDSVAAEMVNNANSLGGYDNITVILARFGGKTA